MKIIFQGDIWNVDLGIPYGSEQGGVRPCLVIQNNTSNEHSPTVVILPMTSKNKQYVESHVEVNTLDEKPSFILCEQITTVDKGRFRKKVGKIDDYDMKRVRIRLSSHLGW